MLLCIMSDHCKEIFDLKCKNVLLSVIKTIAALIWVMARKSFGTTVLDLKANNKWILFFENFNFKMRSMRDKTFP